MAVKFVKRTTAPTRDNRYYYADNVFEQSGFGMPNCTAYAWGRFYELTGEYPRLYTGDAENWWDYQDGYQRGSTPRLGAVIVWRRGRTHDDSDGAGHVAIVEEIYNDGSFLISQSAWNGTNFWTEVIGADCVFGPAYTFMGFIYNPIEFVPEDYIEPVDKSQVVSGNRYLSLEEMQINARYLYQELSARGWTLNAIAGMMGNFQAESTINPAIWESLDEGDTEQGYGLVQWTPASKYINWCNDNHLTPSDIDSAIARIEWELANGVQYYSTDEYPLSFREFKTSTRNAYYLGMAFVTNYERPAEISTVRGKNAEYWYDYLLNNAAGKPSKPKWNGFKGKNMPLLLLVTATSPRR